jgi:hypothetical protein
MAMELKVPVLLQKLLLILLLLESMQEILPPIKLLLKKMQKILQAYSKVLLILKISWAMEILLVL